MKHFYILLILGSFAKGTVHARDNIEGGRRMKREEKYDDENDVAERNRRHKALLAYNEVQVNARAITEEAQQRFDAENQKLAEATAALEAFKSEQHHHLTEIAQTGARIQKHQALSTEYQKIQSLIYDFFGVEATNFGENFAVYLRESWATDTENCPPFAMRAQACPLVKQILQTFASEKSRLAEFGIEIEEANSSAPALFYRACLNGDINKLEALAAQLSTTLEHRAGVLQKLKDHDAQLADLAAELSSLEVRLNQVAASRDGALKNLSAMQANLDAVNARQAQLASEYANFQVKVHTRTVYESL